MVVSTLNSRRRIFHYPECTYASRIKEENLVTFFSKDEARACGYRHCIHCSRLLKYYKEDQVVLQDNQQLDSGMDDFDIVL